MTCLTCNNWRLKDAGAMARHGYGNCSLRKKWYFFAPQNTCDSHTPASGEVVDARRTYLDKGGRNG